MIKKEIPTFAPWLGIFETLKVIEGRILFFKEHFQLLKEGAQILGLKAPTEKAIKKIAVPNQTGRLRWVLNLEGFRTIFSQEKEFKRGSSVLAVSQVRVGSQNWDARYKTVSYLSHWQARLECEKVDEVVLLNEWDDIASVSMANIFWAKNGILYTPSVDCGCRNGVVRQWVLRQMKVKVGKFGLDQLAQADEIFLTNSMRGVHPVRQFLGARISKRQMARALIQKWNQLI